jgi:hypothetical protein
VGSNGIVRCLPGTRSGLQSGEIEGPAVAIPEFFADGAIEAFDEAVEFRGMGWQDVKRDAGVAAGEFELTHELRIAIDLDGANREGHAGDQVGEVVASGAGGGTTADGEDGYAAGDIDGGELAAFESGARADVHGIELDESTERGDGMVGIRMA